MPTGQEVEGSKLHPLSLVSIVVGIAIIVIVAIFFRERSASLPKAKEQALSSILQIVGLI
jgi:hypothetical protein